MIEPKGLRRTSRLAHSIDLSLDGILQAKCPEDYLGGLEVQVACLEAYLEAIDFVTESVGRHQGSHPKRKAATTCTSHLAVADGGVKMVAAEGFPTSGGAAAEASTAKDVAAGGDDTGVHLQRLGEARQEAEKNKPTLQPK